jgi:hypothetical protein
MDKQAADQKKKFHTPYFFLFQDSLFLKTWSIAVLIDAMKTER